MNKIALLQIKIVQRLKHIDILVINIIILDTNKPKYINKHM